jgi:CubicO group peptidase (beta-lactamase class C family)
VKRCLALFALLFISFQTRAAEIDVKAIDALVEKARKGFDVPGIAVVIVKDNEVVHLKGYGLRERTGTDEITQDSLFAIASCSKAFCAMLIAMHADEKKIDWDDSIRKHIAFFRLGDPLADQNITIRDLLCHRSGLSRHDMLRYRAPWSHEEIIRRMADLKPTTSFRSTWEYNNLCFMTAGFAAEVVEKTPYAELLKKRIFGPLGMKTASGSAREVDKSADRATPHLKDLSGVVSAVPRYMQEVDGAGGINASARDLGNWIRFQLGDGTWEGKRLVSVKNLREMHTPQMVVRSATLPSDVTTQRSYGLGWDVQDYRGKPMVEHGGSIDGFRSRVVLLPKDKMGVAVLCNLGGTGCPDALSNALVDLFMNAPARDWVGPGVKTDLKNLQARKTALAKLDQERKKDTKPSHALKSFAGSYTAPAYGEAKVTLDNESLTLLYSSYTLKLAHYHLDSFRITDTPLQLQPLWEKEVITFRLDAKGDVAGMKFVGQEFQRKR